MSRVESSSNDNGRQLTAVILAAGRGTRMGEITRTTPKPLVPVLGRPALEWVVDALAEAGVTDFVIVTGYLGDQVREVVEQFRSTKPGQFSCVHQEEQLGTGHAMKLTAGTVNRTEAVILAFADIMTAGSNYKAMVDRFYRNRCDVVGGVRDVGDPYKAAAVYMDADGNIERIIEKPPMGSSTTPWAHAGMYCFSPEIYTYLEKLVPSARGEYEVTDAVAMMIADGKRCQAQGLTGYWKDLATPEDVREAESLMTAAGLAP